MKLLLKIVVVLLMLVSIGCSELYYPDVDSDVKALVVEGMITNDSGPFTVKLTQTMPYDTDPNITPPEVSDARVELMDNQGGLFPFSNQGFGKYTLPDTFQAKIGNTYVLKITTSDDAIYQSKPQVLYAPQVFDSLKTTFTTTDYLDQYNTLSRVNCWDVRVHLFNQVSADNPLPLCRFESKITLQFSYMDTSTIDPVTCLKPMNWYWRVFGWKSYLLDAQENITEKRTNPDDPVIADHLLCQVPLEKRSYNIFNPEAYIKCYYCRFKQYTIHEDTYEFYKQANKQLLASGKIFDPIASQLYGNMKCITDTTKLVLGFFEVSSVSKGAFVLEGYYPVAPASLRQVAYRTIPDKATYRYKVWVGRQERPKEPEYNEIPFPDWWLHEK